MMATIFKKSAARALAAAFALYGVTAATQAEAARYLAKFQGTVVEGWDNGTGVFAALNNSRLLTNLPYVATFVFDTLHPGATLYTDDNGYGRFVNLGGDFGANPVMATLTIGGRSASYGSYNGTVQVQDGGLGVPPGSYDVVGYSAGNLTNGFKTGGINLYMVSSVNDFVSSPTLPGPLNYGPQADDIAEGVFNWTVRDADGNPLSEAYGSLSVESLVVTLASAPSGVPEPATWISMVLGFGMIGAVIRRRTTAKGFVRFG